MKLAITAALLVGAASLVSAPAGAQNAQTAAPPANAIGRSGALPMTQQPTAVRGFAAQPSTTPATAPAAAAPGAPK